MAGLSPRFFKQPAALVEIEAGALVVVIGELAVEGGGDHRDRQQPLLQRAHRHAGAGVGVHHHLVARRVGHVDGRMDDEAGIVHRMLRLADIVAVEVDLHQVRGGDLVVVQAERVDQEVRLARPARAR